tara:strand:+ start:93 stop:500 length:408 start_codon:yes stop_codon:yes gene_type:complete
MANTVTKERLSAHKQRLLVSNAETGLTTNYAIAIDEINVEAYDRATIQFRNADSNAQTAQVWGSLYGEPTTVGTTAVPASSYWVQIGDDIAIGATSSAMKSISTTGLRKLCVRVKSAGSYTMPIEQVLVHCQGTI